MMPYSMYPAQQYPQYAFYPAQMPSIPPSQMKSGATKTIALTGWPDNVKERELNNLLLFFTGYQASVMLWGSTGIEGRALFAGPAQALEAITKLDGLEFEPGRILKAAMAVEDLDLGAAAIPMPIAASSQQQQQQLQQQQQQQQQQQVKTSPRSPDHLPATPTGIAPSLHHPFAQQVHPSSGGMLPFPGAAPFVPPFQMAAAAQAGMLAPRAYAPVKNERDNPPCNTLFIGNLGESVLEEELRAVFGPQPGFQQLKLVRSPRGISAFIEFTDTTAAEAAHDSQQGLILSSSDRGPIRVQFSKNPFGRKREGIGGGIGGLGGGLPGSPHAQVTMPMSPMTAMASPVHMYGAYGMPMSQPAMVPHGFIYSTSPSGTTAVFPAQMMATGPPPPHHHQGIPVPPPPPQSHSYSHQGSDDGGGGEEEA